MQIRIKPHHQKLNDEAFLLPKAEKYLILKKRKQQGTKMRIFCFSVVLGIAIVTWTSSFAGVRFLVNGPETQYNDSFRDEDSSSNYQASRSEITKCENAGYIYKSCDRGMILRKRCPYHSSYYAECCPEDYRYSPQDCYQMNKTTSTYTCGGFYACY